MMGFAPLSDLPLCALPDQDSPNTFWTQIPATPGDWTIVSQEAA